MQLINLSQQGKVIAAELVLADHFASRLRGLLGRRCLSDSEGLLLLPCNSVHTCWMRFSLDLLFIGRSGRILRIAENVVPWSLLRCAGAHAVAELAAGTVQRCGCCVGDQVSWK